VSASYADILVSYSESLQHSARHAPGEDRECDEGENRVITRIHESVGQQETVVAKIEEEFKEQDILIMYSETQTVVETQSADEKRLAAEAAVILADAVHRSDVVVAALVAEEETEAAAKLQ
jgi:hypothetical protein